MRQIMTRLQYRLDSMMSRGPRALLIPLGIIVGIMLAIVTAGILVSGVMADRDLGLIDIIWTVFGYMYVPVAVAPSEGGWGLRILLFVASFTGIVVLSTLISIITTSFAASIANLRKGKSVVEESNHTVILGWSEQIYGIVQELLIANANIKKACIVILADEDKVEMEDRLRARIKDYGNTRVVCRSGSPIDMTDLAIARPERARSIVVLAPENHSDPDSIVVKTLLAIVRGDGADATSPIVATMRDVRNIEVASIIAGSRVRVIPNELVISQIIAQTCRQAGLSMVYTELLDFGGDELYIKHEAELSGKTFGVASRLYEDSTLVGIRHADGRVTVNPATETVIENGDSVIVLASDDDAIHLRTSEAPTIDAQTIVPIAQVTPQPERILILGWNERGSTVAAELDHYVQPGSIVHVVHHVDHSETIAALNANTASLELIFTQGETTSRAVLDSLRVTEFDSIVVLADRDAGGVQEADARTLMSVIHLRDILRRSPHQVNMVTEMLDDRNRSLATVASDQDYIVSNKITSLLLTQIAESPDLALVFADLFNADGSELYLKNASHYVRPNTAVNFATVSEAAAKRNEVALGFRVIENGVARVQLNVNKSSIHTFKSDDAIIVIAHD